jgi:aspartate carbamoyltransferase regulatory subunit
MTKNAHTIIDHLSPGDALAILKLLAREDDRLGAHIAEVATSYSRFAQILTRF